MFSLFIETVGETTAFPETISFRNMNISIYMAINTIRAVQKKLVLREQTDSTKTKTVAKNNSQILLEDVVQR